ncbi:hypothetical protein [Dongia sedimenti]|uniref:Uncharacterized protein n=1 Tax=Dongia sedimenti TaxID=3064282 RepID=A0ABU0YTY1_9PROT|nr:hypothetical protein [Rhodospirillaceae bacterium R-7]
MRAISLLAVLFFASVAQARAEFFDTRHVAGWEISAFRSDDGIFTGCLVSAEYKSGIELDFFINRAFDWEMWLWHTDWRLTNGAHYDLAVSFDGGSNLAVSGRANEDNMVIVPLDGALFGRFKAARLLRVHAASGPMEFYLDGSSRALSAGLDCTKRWAGDAPTNPTDPFSGGSAANPSDPFSPPARSQNPSASRGEAEVIPLLTGILKAAGIDDYTFLPSAEKDRSLAGFDAAWEADGVIGGMSVLPDATFEHLSGLMSDLTGATAKDCGGKFASYMPAENTSPPVLRRLVVACSGAGEDWEGHYVLLNRTTGGAYLLLVTSDLRSDGVSPARDADERIIRAVLRK